jgi:hypothetical protein
MPFQFEISGPELLDTLLRVYDDACREVGVTEKPSEPAWNSERRARIAAAILERARRRNRPIGIEGVCCEPISIARRISDEPMPPSLSLCERRHSFRRDDFRRAEVHYFTNRRSFNKDVSIHPISPNR